MKIYRRSVAVAALLAFGGSSAIAGLSVSSAIPSGKSLLSDNSAEYMIDRGDGEGGVVANGNLDVGDSLRGIFRVETVEPFLGPDVDIGGSSPYNELTAIFQTVVLSKTAVGGGLFNYTFGYDAASGFGAGVLAQLFDDPANDFTRLGCATFALCEATATGGVLWAELGFLGAGAFWSAKGAPETPGVGALLPLTSPLGGFSVGLEFITNNTGYQWNKVGCLDQTDNSIHIVDVCGQGGLLASGRLDPTGATPTPYDIFNNVDFTVNRVPEPGSLALIALGLLAAGVATRKQKI